jgi:hypothetical protein
LFVNSPFKVVVSLMSWWGVPCLTLCKMWEHGGCLEGVQQDAISKCDYLDGHDIGTCELWAEGTGTISTNATRCAPNLYSFYGGAECMCHHKWCLKRADVFMSGSIKVIVSLMSLWGKVGWHVFLNVVAQRMLGECSTRHHLEM